MRHRWQRQREPVAHIDDWLMTYADVITLLLCCFAIFLTLSHPKKEPAQNPPVVAQPQRPHEIAVVVVPRYETVEPDADAAPKETAPAPPAQAAEKPPAALPVTVDQLKRAGPAGDRITTLEMSSAAFFDPGSATLSDAGKAVLADIAVTLGADRFRGYQITVEGHTDDTPIKTAQFPSNWELSTARAASVVHFFLDQGIPAPKLRAAGYADTFPEAPNRDAVGNPIPENQARNRRVVIKLEKIDKTG